MVAGHGDPGAHQELVAGAAHPGQVDPGGALVLGLFEQVRVLAGAQQHLRDYRVVPVDHDVHLVLLEHAGVYPGRAGLGRAEEDVGDLGGDHGPAPAVRERVADAVQEQALPVVVDPHVGAVHHLGGFAVDSPRGDPQPAPDLLALGRRALEQGELLLARAVFLGHGIGELGGDLVRLLAVQLDPELDRHALELLDVAQPVAGGRVHGHLAEDLDQVAAVIRVRGGAGGDHAAQVARHHDVGIRAAHPALGAFAERIDTAGSHDADAAAQPHLAETAIGQLGLEPVPDAFHAVALHLLQQQPAVRGDRVGIVSLVVHGGLLIVQARSVCVSWRSAA